ncbi:MAG: type IV secretory system conjugative DNA transfer family protein [Candidatus Obscuribacterales bacterium]|nr:type IV secretory system conjugative DNA transfer family protein [Candidatus Obscuribacterales bacterium]
MNDRGVVARYRNTDTGETITAKEYERRLQMQDNQYLLAPGSAMPQMTVAPAGGHVNENGVYVPNGGGYPVVPQQVVQPNGMVVQSTSAYPAHPGTSPLIQNGAQMASGQQGQQMAAAPQAQPQQGQPINNVGTTGQNLRLESNSTPAANSNMFFQPAQQHGNQSYKPKGFIDATSVALMIPTLVILAIIIAAAHKKRLFPWQTVRTFNPPSGLMTPREYERSFLCPPNLRKHGRMGKRNPNATWTEEDGIVLPFGFLARTHLPITVPLGRLPNKNMFMVAPSGSGKTTLMRAIIKAMLAKPCVIIALEAKANDPDLDERREGFKYTILPEAQQAGFETLYFNPLDANSIHWNPLDLEPLVFASSIVRDVNSLPPEEQHWAERDHGYIAGLATLLKWGAVQVSGEDENGVPTEIMTLPCNPRGLMRLVNNRRNIVESLRNLKNNPDVDPAELNELTQTLSSIIRTDSDWDKNIQGVRGRLRMFKNANILRVTEESNVDVRGSMHKPTVFIFGAPASLGPDAESLSACFVYQLEQALHTRYGTASVLPLFAFFDEYQTLNIDIAGKLSAIVRGANGGLAVILQNITQIAGKMSGDPTSSGGAELKTIFSNSAVRICLHNADESTSRFFSDEIGKHAVIVPGIADQFTGDSIFPVAWRRIHSQQVVARVDSDSIKRMEKHHALVFMAPAGDSEFGETKPLMVDLRGIEEIARLHLLHNVSNKPGPESAAPTPADEESYSESADVLPMFAGATAPTPPMANDIMSIIKGEAAVVAEEAAHKTAEGLSKAAHSIENIAEHLKTPIRKQEPPKEEPAKTDDAELAVKAELLDKAVAEDAGAKVIAETAATEAPKPKAKEPSKGRVCPYCSKQAGKGRFCIECGKELGMPDKGNTGLSALDLSDTLRQLKIPAQPPTASRFPASTTNPVSDPGFAVEKKTAAPVATAPGEERRAPLKSLHEDPFRRIPRREATPGLSQPPVDLPKPEQVGYPGNVWFGAEDKSKNVEF